MAEEFNFGAITGVDGAGVATFQASTSIVIFQRGSRLNQGRSMQMGAPQYDPVDMIKIIRPGERDTIERLADESDKRMYPEQWRAYKEGTEVRISGTPLETLFPANPDLVQTLRAQRVHTVQQLAEISDSVLPQIQFGHEMREKARRYLHVAQKGVDFHRHEKEIEEIQFRNRELEGQMQAMRQQMDAMAAQLRQTQQPLGTGFQPAVAPALPLQSARPAALDYDYGEDASDNSGDGAPVGEEAADNDTPTPAPTPRARRR